MIVLIGGIYNMAVDVTHETEKTRANNMVGNVIKGAAFGEFEFIYVGY
jgi:hypothetical protein